MSLGDHPFTAAVSGYYGYAGVLLAVGAAAAVNLV